MKKNSSNNNEAILSHVIHNMPDYVLWKDINSVYIGCNLNAAKLFGLKSTNQIIDKTDNEIFPDQAKELIKYDKLVLKTGKEYKTNLQIKKINKNESDFLNVEIKPLKNNQQILGILYIAKDVTNYEKDKTRLDELINEQESSYNILEKAVTEITGQRFHKRLSIKQYVDELSNCFKNIILQMPCYVYWKDKNFKYIYCNELSAEILGLKSVEEVVGKTDYDFGWDPEIVNEYRKIDAEIVKTGQPKLGFEETLIKDNKEYHLLVNKMPLLNNNGKVIGIIGISIDITDRKKTEQLKLEAVDEQSNSFKNIILQMPCYVYWKDKEYKYIFCNELSAKVLGLKSVEEVIGKTDYDFGLDPDIAKEYRKVDEEIINTGKAQLGIEETLIKNGKTYYLSGNKMPLLNNKGEIIGIVGIAVDITDRKEAEKLKLETQAQQVIIDAQQDIKKFIDTVQNAIQMYKINDLNNKLGIKKPILQNVPSNLKLTKREGQILFYLSLSKPPKEISRIITSLEKKPVTANTIQSIINKQLYPKFKVHNLSQLIEVALALGLI